MNIKSKAVAVLGGALITTTVLAPAAWADQEPSGPGAFMSGHTTQKRNGLTCENRWYNTYGGTTCSGGSGAQNVKWRVHVACAAQSDYTGPWSYGSGSGGFECNFSVQNSSVEWG
ncbi:hypothetical protein V5P93_004002 [Actinokineospora auranticolor]|uniref:Lactococcin 972 family bacteriocin n=1 Tax=Actinokineospora auranticolor TaxID=155976 RepID=A0A2S6GCU1_9PSEU|nr:hypothetical protein [Actinokineospora auranticolor]PPK62747.1 hypothetical protein CLV40_13313 [Actinokineospora auranticolor]